MSMYNLKEVNHNKKIYNLRESALITLLWMGAAVLFIFIKINDLSKCAVVEGYQLQYWVTKLYIYYIALLLSALTGILMGIMQLYVYPSLRKKKVSFILGVRLLMLLLLISFLSAVYYFFFFDRNIPSFNFLLVLSISVYALLVESLITLVLLLKKNLGAGYFSDFFKSKYLTPSEEKRVFLFIDMVDSTVLGQRLGSYRYSRLMQDCFGDLSEVALEYNGSVYQFVGDEAVLTWKTGKAYLPDDSLDFYFAFLSALDLKKEYYKKAYGITPKFRAAISSGNVTIALVGNIKREIAYYGNVLNTCSRLQKLPRNDGNQIIISESFYRDVAPSKKYLFTLFSGFSLKGIPDIKHAYMVQQILQFPVI